MNFNFGVLTRTTGPDLSLLLEVDHTNPAISVRKRNHPSLFNTLCDEKMIQEIIDTLFGYCFPWSNNRRNAPERTRYSPLYSAYVPVILYQQAC